MNSPETYRNKVAQYGVRGSLNRLYKKILRKFGIILESEILMVCHLKEKFKLPKLKIKGNFRVLLIDDYAIYFNAKMEKDFRMKINNMNRTLGTTIILSSPTDMYLKYFASVLIFLDHGHIYKIRPGVVSNKKTVANRKTKSKNYRPRKRNRNHKKK